MLKENEDKLLKIVNKYLDEKSKKEFLDIVLPIVEHPEFQKRMSNTFLHHSDITLGEHLIEDAAVTYCLCKKEKKKVNLNLAVKIALFHDLYTIPWQNNKKNTKVKKISNKHGFRHPIEAVINAYTWYPNEFENITNARIIIDGIIHHMYPLPVTRFNEKNVEKCEIRNYDKFIELPDYIKKIIYESCNRGKLFKVSLCRSKYKDGRLMSKADKKVSIHQIKNVSSAFSLLTGKNRSIKK